MALKDLEIKYAARRSRDYKLFDGEGLYVLVRPGGSKLWRFKYAFQGKEKTLSLGKYPGLSAAAARQKRNDAKALLAKGIDPGEEKKASKRTLPPPELFEPIARVGARFAAAPFCEGGFYGERTKRFGRLLIRSPHIAGLVMHPAMLALAEAALGNWCERIQLNLTQAIEIHPGALAQFPHRDQDMWQGSLGEAEYLLNVMWPLTDFTEENGATLIWPHSHGLEALVEEPREKPVAAAAAPGDAIVFLGSTLHGAGANRSAGVRRGIIVSYCLGWLKPYENQWLAYPPEVARGFAPDLAALAGYTQHRPNLGNFEGQCPSVLFGGYRAKRGRLRPARLDDEGPRRVMRDMEAAAAAEKDDAPLARADPHLDAGAFHQCHPCPVGQDGLVGHRGICGELRRAVIACRIPGKAEGDRGREDRDESPARGGRRRAPAPQASRQPRAREMLRKFIILSRRGVGGRIFGLRMPGVERGPLAVGAGLKHLVEPDMRLAVGALHFAPLERRSAARALLIWLSTVFTLTPLIRAISG